MCGRFTLRAPAADWCQLLLPELIPEAIPIHDPPRYNIAPTQPIVCLLREAAGQPPTAVKARWGLVPPWAKDLAIGNRMINARGETVDTKASFKKPLAAHRCLIPADGYYEWTKTETGKQPHLIELIKGGPFAMAGLWDVNRSFAEDGQPIRSCTIITTQANQTTAHVHDRMPVILNPTDFQRWLDPGFRDLTKLKQLLQPASESLLKTTLVSRHVNNVRHEDPTCVDPI
ncbi:MAG: SOS response-associated peptidase [Rubripirellula sp.]